MVDGLGADRRRADLPLARRRVAKRDRAGQLAHLDRRQRGGDVAGDAVLERGLGRSRPPDRDLHVGPEAGREEHQALDVVEVQVGEQDVDLRCGDAGRGPGCGCPVPASRISSSPLSRHELHAGRVPAVAVHLRPRRRNRASRSPDLDPHRRTSSPPFASSGQKKIIAPEDPCSEATIGKALDSISCSSPARRADPEHGVGGAAVADRLGGRKIVQRHRLAVVAERPVGGGPLLGAHAPRRPRTSAPAARRRPRCRRPAPRARRPGRRVSRCWSAGCGPGSARGASGREPPSCSFSHPSSQSARSRAR